MKQLTQGIKQMNLSKKILGRAMALLLGMQGINPFSRFTGNL
jgi:hypothetical protein